MKLLLAALALPLLAVGADFRPIFNGKDLTGWKMTGPGRFVIENGMMKTEGGMGLIYYEKEKVGDAAEHAVPLDRQTNGRVAALQRGQCTQDDCDFVLGCLRMLDDLHVAVSCGTITTRRRP